MAHLNPVQTQLLWSPKGQLKYLSEATSPVEMLSIPSEIRAPFLPKVCTSYGLREESIKHERCTKQTVGCENGLPLHENLSHVSPEPKSCKDSSVVSNHSAETFLNVPQSKWFVHRMEVFTDLKNEIDEKPNSLLQRRYEQRLQNMKDVLQAFDDEHAETLKVINRMFNERLVLEETNILQQEDEIEQLHESELEKCKLALNSHTLAAAEKVKALQARQLEIEEQRRKSEGIKLERLKKLKVLEDLRNTTKAVCSNTINMLRWCKQQDRELEKVSSLSVQVSSDYALCIEVIRSAFQLQDGLDEKTALVRQKLQNLELLSKASHNLVDSIKERKAIEEKQDKESQQPVQREDAPSVKVAETKSDPPSLTLNNTSQESVSISTAQAESKASLESATDDLSNCLHLYTSRMVFAEYERVSEVLKKMEASYEKLSNSTDPAIKTFKFDLYKAVNTAVNAISDESPRHLMDKIMRLNNLLSGKEVEVGSKKIALAGHPMAMGLCKDLFSKKLVMQGVQQVSSSFKAAFPLAAVAASIAALHPEVNELMLGHYYRKCPYLVPFYIPPRPGQSTSDYCKILGYEVNGNEVESEEKYIKKLSGVVRLYAAVLQTELPPMLGSKPHPHGLEHGWMWFVRVLNLEPRPNVTATILYDFLQVAGHAMMVRYRKQFQKLLAVLCSEYISKIELVTPLESKASVMRLKMFLEECIKSGKIPVPEGHLSSQWWISGR